MFAVMFAAGSLYADAVSNRQTMSLLYYYNNNKYAIGTERGNVTKAYSILSLAAKGNAAITSSDIAYANELLAVLYTNWPQPDLASGIYWMLPHLSRILAGNDMNVYLTENARNSIKDVLYAFVSQEDDLAYASTDLANLHHIVNSENHDMLAKQVFLNSAQAFKNDPAWNSIVYPDGKSAAEHYYQWQTYFKQYFQEKASTGMNVEVGSPTYAGVYLESVYIIRDLAEDKDLVKRAEQYLNLYFADMAVCSINGIRGGAKSRCYKDSSSYTYTTDRSSYYAWMLTGEPVGLGSGNTAYDVLPSLNSDFRIHDRVLNLFDQDARGSYEYIAARPGEGTNFWDEGGSPHYDMLFPSRIRWYSWCTPQFILGSVTLDENEVYTPISEQNRWYGLIAANNPDSRIYFSPESTANTYNDYIAVQYKGAMLIRKSSKASASLGFKMFVSSSFSRISESQWIFGLNSNNSVYYGVYAVQGDLWGTRYTQAAAAFEGTWITFTIPNSIIVLQVGLASDYAGFDAFKTLVKSRSKGLTGTRYNYTAIDDSAVLSMYTDTSLPQINGVNVNLEPEKKFNSPFINSDYDSTILVITDTNNESIILDFTSKAGADSLVGDINKDGYVDIYDLAVIASQWGMDTLPTN